MTAVATPAERVSKRTPSRQIEDDLRRISEIPGAELPLEACRWPKDQSGANGHFWLLLGELTGRLEPSADGCYGQRGHPDIWLRLDQIDEAALRRVLGRMRRMYSHWMFDIGRAETLLDQIDVHFGTAQRRKNRGL
jgi:hypothetical protein